ncbi:MAG: hypothetical protein CVT82_05610 [Alphaproteobacteria bacterium HGW-Alphaproteobacteria-4]|nr:MAG: hypothetical protein CVT82_05610 [Alphaproteobacteria bacterium HGW-Alphaproteobacteria-4]
MLRKPAAIGAKHVPDRLQTKEPLIMSRRLRLIVENERLTRATHWTVFSLGALTLVFSVLATAVRAFGG